MFSLASLLTRGVTEIISANLVSTSSAFFVSLKSHNLKGLLSVLQPDGAHSTRVCFLCFHLLVNTGNISAQLDQIKPLLLSC